MSSLILVLVAILAVVYIGCVVLGLSCGDNLPDAMKEGAWVTWIVVRKVGAVLKKCCKAIGSKIVGIGAPSSLSSRDQWALEQYARDQQTRLKEYRLNESGFDTVSNVRVDPSVDNDLHMPNACVEATMKAFGKALQVKVYFDKRDIILASFGRDELKNLNWDEFYVQANRYLKYKGDERELSARSGEKYKGSLEVVLHRECPYLQEPIPFADYKIDECQEYGLIVSAEKKRLELNEVLENNFRMERFRFANGYIDPTDENKYRKPHVMLRMRLSVRGRAEDMSVAIPESGFAWGTFGRDEIKPRDWSELVCEFRRYLELAKSEGEKRRAREKEEMEAAAEMTSSRDQWALEKYAKDQQTRLEEHRFNEAGFDTVSNARVDPSGGNDLHVPNACVEATMKAFGKVLQVKVYFDKRHIILASFGRDELKNLSWDEFYVQANRYLKYKGDERELSARSGEEYKCTLEGEGQCSSGFEIDECQEYGLIVSSEKKRLELNDLLANHSRTERFRFGDGRIVLTDENKYRTPHVLLRMRLSVRGRAEDMSFAIAESGFVGGTIGRDEIERRDWSGLVRKFCEYLDLAEGECEEGRAREEEEMEAAEAEAKCRAEQEVAGNDEEKAHLEASSLCADSDGSQASLDEISRLVADSPNDWLKQLSDFSFPERWTIRGGRKYSVLQSYVAYTFERLRRQNKVLIDDQAGLAVFNSGLRSRAGRDDVYVVFEKREGGSLSAWGFAGVCVPGQEWLGKKILRCLPSAANLPRAEWLPATSPERVFDAKIEIKPNWDHLIGDNLPRLPFDLVKRCVVGDAAMQEIVKQISKKRWGRNVEKDRRYADLRHFLTDRQKSYLRALLEDALRMTINMILDNPAVAVPHYYPREDSFGFMLPLDLEGSSGADVALVVERLNGGNDVCVYQGQTILAMSMAYSDARLLQTPEVAWLRDFIAQEGVDEM